MPKSTREQMVSAMQALALEASLSAGRMAPALLAMEQADGPLRSSLGAGGSSGGVSRPVEHAVGLCGPEDRPVTPKRDVAAEDRRRAERLVWSMLEMSKELAGLLGAWVPDADAQSKLRGVRLDEESMWCPNHREHGIDEVRPTGRQLCGFCAGFKRKHGCLPTRWILDVRQRRRLNSADELYELELQRESARREREEKRLKDRERKAAQRASVSTDADQSKAQGA